MATPKQLVADLVGKPYAKPGTVGHIARTGYDCWSLAVEVMKRLGWRLPENPADAMLEAQRRARFVGDKEACQAADVIEIHSAEEVHVGVALDAFEFIHVTSTSRVRISKISAARTCGIVRRVHRLYTAEKENKGAA